MLVACKQVLALVGVVYKQALALVAVVCKLVFVEVLVYNFVLVERGLERNMSLLEVLV